MAVGAFYESLATLDETEETVQAYKGLMLRVAIHPDRGVPVAGMQIHVMKTRAWGAFPALRVFYWFDEEGIYLLHVGRYAQVA
jgi:hypothetical protein